MLREARRFAVAGVCVTLVHVVIAAGLIGLARTAPEAANAMAFVAATLLSYAINTWWTFSRPLQGQALLRFITVSLLGLALTVAIAAIAEARGVSYWLGIAAVVCAVPPVTFLLHKAWTYREPAPAFPGDAGVWLAMLGGVGAFLMATGGAVLDPRRTDWLFLAPDSATAFLGWQFFRQAPLLQWPLGANPGYGMELGTSLVFSDSIPLLGFIFKPFAGLLPDVFQYFGLWVLLSLVLQALFAYKLLGRFSQDRWLTLLGSAFFVLAPVCLARLQQHFALLGHWTVLAALYLYFAPRFSRAAWLLLLAGSALIHFYFLAMAALILGADLWQRCWRREIAAARAAGYLAAGAALSLAVMWLAGYFVVGHSVEESGYGRFRMNLLSLADANNLWSRLLPDLPSTQDEDEGFNYLGLGILLLALVAAGAALLQRRAAALERSTMVPLLLLSLGLLVLAASNRVALGRLELFDYSIPGLLAPAAGAMRVSGRLFWPVYYVIYLGILVLVFRALPRRAAIGVCAVALAAHVADSSSALRYFNQRFVHAQLKPSPLRSALWGEIAKRYQRVRYVLPRNAMDTFLPWAAFAAEHGMAVNFGYFARLNAEKVAAARHAVETAILGDALQSDSLYVFENDGPFFASGLWALASARAGSSDVVGVLDGFRILAPKLKECASCDLSALADVRTEKPSGYALGERVSFAEKTGGRKYAGAGWSYSVGQGMWSESPVASLVLGLERVPPGDLVLAIEGSAFVSAQHPRQEIEVSINGAIVGTLIYGAPAKVESKSLRLPRAVLSQAPGPMVIQFRSRDAKSPHELGWNDDRRRLGLWLMAIRLSAGSGAGP